MSMRPASGVSASRSSMSSSMSSSMTWSSLCFTFQAVVCVTPTRRASSTEDMPVLDCVRWYMAWNHRLSGNLLAWKIGPAVNDA
jgi:hypothetical protein